MSLLDNVNAKSICAVDNIVQHKSEFSKQLDPKRFDMCIVMTESDKGSESSRFVELYSHIEYISSNTCDDYEICRFNYDEIMNQQIGNWLCDEKYNNTFTFYIVQFSAKKMKYARFVASITSLWKNVDYDGYYKMHLFWSVGGGFLGDYRWKMIHKPQLFHGIWKIVLWNLTSERYYNEVAEFFVNTVGHSNNEDLDAYGDCCVNMIKHMQTSHKKVIDKINNKMILSGKCY